MGNSGNVVPALHLPLWVGQSHIAFHHQREGLLVAAHVVEQTEAVLPFQPVRTGILANQGMRADFMELGWMMA